MNSPYYIYPYIFFNTHRYNMETNKVFIYCGMGVWEKCSSVNEIKTYQLDSLEEITQQCLFGILGENSTLIKPIDQSRLERQRKQVMGLLNVTNIRPTYYFYQVSLADGKTRNYVVGPRAVSGILKAAKIDYRVEFSTEKEETVYYELQ